MSSDRIAHRNYGGTGSGLRDGHSVTEIRGGTVVTPEGTIEDGCILLERGWIRDVRSTTGSDAATVIDASDRVIMPGIVDLHGDDIEHHLFPRSGARVDERLALSAADRANVASGVTTKFHAISFEDAVEENRTLDLARDLTRTIQETDGFLGNNRVHARCELGCESHDAVEDFLTDNVVDLVSLVNHVPGSGQFDDVEEFQRRYVGDRDLSSSAVEQLAERRSSVSSDVVNDRVEAIVENAHASGIPLASHDDETPAEVERAATCGATICEYPLTMAAARRATELGMYTVMGAPNLVRGGSLWDNLDAREAAREGVVDVLCSDYHPPSLLAAPFVETGEPLHVRVARVTKNPADVVGLLRRGRLERGARADVLVVDPEPVPTVDHAFVGGRDVFRASDRSMSPEPPDRNREPSEFR
ncbi:alpha-D-ribose 1-methylphosphonate 5-triphosphate diphosphatase [Halalkaliarchaeum sp. AArc-GB]|uniref:alpha-D-ribose 1-methylphosphonate 5-triphosphate diphosphatase n=1 Tax=Halalkaliarchaeum sp. AArc-GB TaxID=3074078 RepID=UPI002854E7C9|nr:alpha-D-ribose 1-methylphosphonate 5-triphosphate diphosphatase [Halalkaliarchaeum sp. AArc-GB]MDR5674623.1 alpha-D-ribose 1-methylphosphonate 5-triphosphate diphosphatase [Halalkaliarchaeum sp. AArc-GB]